MRYVCSILIVSLAALAVDGSDCYPRRNLYAPTNYYVPYVAPLVTYYPPTPASYVPAYSQSYGLSEEGVRLFDKLLEREAQREARDAAREAKYDLLLQKALEGGILAPAKTVSRHPGLAVLNNACAVCHDSARGKPKGDFGFLKGGVFVDEGDNLARVLDSIDLFGPKAKGGRAHMPPAPHEPLKDRDSLAINSYLNRLPPPEAAAKTAPKTAGEFP
jgi:mono/diheme cytochrome c family protein